MDKLIKLFSNGFSVEYYAAPFRTFAWRDAFDILLLGLLFFAVYAYIRDRRAGRLLFGVGLLVGLYAVVELFDFYALRHILGSFFSYGLIAFVVIFQPEIRSAVERVEQNEK